MRPSILIFAATACLAFAPTAHAQQQAFKPGDPVDFYTFGQWVPCTVDSPLKGNNYTVRCGALGMLAKNDPHVLRARAVPQPALQPTLGNNSPSGSSANSGGGSIGALYATRDPRNCNRRPSRFTATEAKDVFICDAEHEFNGRLFLVSDVSLDVRRTRPFDPNLDSNRPGIDRMQPVIDIRATYNTYQCSRIPASHLDNPNARTCNEYHTTNAAGGCYKNTAGDWHCTLLDFNAPAIATAKNVAPPTLIE